MRDLERTDGVLMPLDDLLDGLTRDVIALYLVVNTPKVHLVPIETKACAGERVLSLAYLDLLLRTSFPHPQ